MTDKQILKLQKLCEHWANHNDSHIENFKKWRNFAKNEGLEIVVENLNKAIEMMENCTKYLLKAKEQLSL